MSYCNRNANRVHSTGFCRSLIRWPSVSRDEIRMGSEMEVECGKQGGPAPQL